MAQPKRPGAAAKAERQAKADARNDERVTRSDTEQLARLDRGGYAAKRERKRIAKRMRQ